MSDDWDLYAVVRSCIPVNSASNPTPTATPTPTPTTATAAAAAAATSSTSRPENTYYPNENCSSEDYSLAFLACLTFEEDDSCQYPILAQPAVNNGSLQDSYTPFLLPSSPTPTITSTNNNNQGFDSSPFISVPEGSTGEHQQQQQWSQQAAAAAAAMEVTFPLAPPTAASFSVFGQSRNQHQLQHIQQEQQNQLNHEVQQQEVLQRAEALRLRPMQAPAPRPRKSRKNQQKRTVYHVTVENLQTDPWAWRKYGQKPIKGSPYPRNYYRCSSSKGCSARKQVERSNLDSNIYIVSYSGDHTHPRPTHRNSLAGSTRNKPANKNSAVEIAASASSSSPSVSPTTSLPAPEEGAAAAPLQNRDDENGTGVGGGEEVDPIAAEIMEQESDEDDDDNILVPNMRIDEDLFKGLEELAGLTGGSESGLGRSPAFGSNFSSWGAGSSAAAGAAAGSG